MDLYRIILVDDEEEVRKSIIRKIDWQAVGFTVVGDAENGEDALEKIEALEPDVVLTDIRMPYMDGLTLAEKIRQRYPSMKIVIFSGYDDFDYAKRAIKLNVTEYILKPVNVEELTAILRRIQESLVGNLCFGVVYCQLLHLFFIFLAVLKYSNQRCCFSLYLLLC